MIFLTEILIWYILLLLVVKLAGKEGLITYIVSAAIIANVETTQFIHVNGLQIPGGLVPFACLFLATDVSSELYGRRFSQKLALFAGFGMVVSSLVIALFCQNHGVSASYQEALGSSARIAFVSVAVYLTCAMFDIDLYHQIGKRTKYKWMRNNASTITAQLINAFLFILLAFGWIGIEPIINNWLISAGLAILDTPMIYLITGRDKLIATDKR